MARQDYLPNREPDLVTWSQNVAIAFDGLSPYLDTRPPQTPNSPDVRRYRLRYCDNQTPVGVFSDTLTVTVGA